MLQEWLVLKLLLPRHLFGRRSVLGADSLAILAAPVCPSAATPSTPNVNLGAARAPSPVRERRFSMVRIRRVDRGPLSAFNNFSPAPEPNASLPASYSAIPA